jgi:cobalt/nickel transport system permease protein
MDIGQMDELGRMDTPAHRLDARAKALVTLAYVVAVMSFPKSDITALMPMALYPVLLMGLGRIPPGPIFRKILVASPFALAVGIFNPLMDHRPAMNLGVWTVSAGWISFASISIRFVLTVGAALTLVACTGMNRLIAGMERMGLPKVFAVQLLFLYRYLFVVFQEGTKMLRGLELRGVRGRSIGWRIYGALTGHLLLRSLDRAERVYRAMVSRGFDGRIRVLPTETFRRSDYVFVAGWLLYFVAVRHWYPAEFLGQWIMGNISWTR